MRDLSKIILGTVFLSSISIFAVNGVVRLLDYYNSQSKRYAKSNEIVVHPDIETLIRLEIYLDKLEEDMTKLNGLEKNVTRKRDYPKVDWKNYTFKFNREKIS